MFDRSVAGMAGSGAGLGESGWLQHVISRSWRFAVSAWILAAGILVVFLPAAPAQAVVVPDGYGGFQFTAPYHTLNPFSVVQLQQIDSGFQIFTVETFGGNGRVCSTCHLPGKNFNVTPADVAAMSTADKVLVRGGTNIELENTESVNELGLFNIDHRFGSGTEGTAGAPHGPFRASMTIGGLGFSTLNRFVCRGGPRGGVGAVAGQEPNDRTPAVTYLNGLPQQNVMRGCALTLAGATNGVNTTFSTGASTRAPDPREFTLYERSAPGSDVVGVLVDPADYELNGTTVEMDIPPPDDPRVLVAYFPGSGTGLDDGTRDSMLGWAGDGSLTGMFGYTGPTVPAEENCEDAVADFSASPTDLTNLEKALRTFSLAAIKTHFPKTQDRIPGTGPGTDFRCPTSTELDNLAKFQTWLGRRFELDITKLQNLKSDAETGRRLFGSRMASCSACHVNAGASAVPARRALDPVPFIHFSNGTLDLFVHNARPGALEIIGANKASRTGIQFLEPALDVTLSTMTFPFDPGDESVRGVEGGFNVTSIIEAVPKTTFFHNNAIRGTIENAIAHYFTPNFDNSTGGSAFFRVSFRPSPPGTPNADGLPIPLGILGEDALAQLEALPLNSVGRTGANAINKMGAFLRVLGSVYALADCERLINEMIFRVNNGLSLARPSQICGFALNDARNMMQGIRVQPNQYQSVVSQLTGIQVAFVQASVAVPNLTLQRSRLVAVQQRIRTTRRSILTTVELP